MTSPRTRAIDTTGNGLLFDLDPPVPPKPAKKPKRPVPAKKGGQPREATTVAKAKAGQSEDASRILHELHVVFEKVRDAGGIERIVNGCWVGQVRDLLEKVRTTRVIVDGAESYLERRVDRLAQPPGPA